MIDSNFTVLLPEAGQRLDILCVAKLPNLSRSVIQRNIKEGAILVNGQSQKPKYTVRTGDVLTIKTPKTPVPSEVQAIIPLIPILYEDNDVVVIDKPPGVSVHPGQGHESATVVSWFIVKYPQAANVGNDPERPGVVHRLDKDTSGVMILAKQAAAWTHLKQQFKRHFAKKKYLALVFGVPGETEGRINRPLARSKRNPLRRTIDESGKPAITEWNREESFRRRFALLRVRPLTGRTHQIRAHLHWLGFPIVGDSLYTFKRQRPPEGVQRQLLHAEKLLLTLPSGARKTFTAPLPDDFSRALELLRQEK